MVQDSFQPAHSRRIWRNRVQPEPGFEEAQFLDYGDEANIGNAAAPPSRVRFRGQQRRDSYRDSWDHVQGDEEYVQPQQPRLAHPAELPAPVPYQHAQDVSMQQQRNMTVATSYIVHPNLAQPQIGGSAHGVSVRQVSRQRNT